MKRFSEQFKNKAEDIRLSTAEKRELRERVVSYMEYHPLPIHNRTVSFVDSTGQTFKFITINAKRLLQLSGSFVLLLALGVSYLAEYAVPGDILYSVKVGFNEELRSTLALSPYDKVVWETERLNRRIAEASLLADEGRLTEEVEAQVASAVKQHSDNARKEIENLKLTDKDEATLASIELSTALDVQTSSLRSRDSEGGEGQSINLIQTVLKESQVTESITEEDNLPAYDRLMAKVESETTRAHELLKGVNSHATFEEKNDISRRLEDIERKVAVAMDLSKNDEKLARQGLVEVLQQTHRLIVFMTNIDVRANLTVDEIVPVTLTNEERIILIQKQVSETRSMLDLVKNTLSASTSNEIDADVLAKVRPAFEQSSTSIVKVKDLMLGTEYNLDQVEALSSEAYDLALDATQLLSIPTPEIPVSEVEDQEVEVIEEVEPSTTTDAILGEESGA